MPLDGGVQSPPRASSGLEMAWPSPRAAPTSWVGSLSTCTRLTANSLPVQHASTSRRTPRPSDRKSAATGGPTGFWQSTLDRGKHEDHNEMAKGDRDGQDRKSGAAGHAGGGQPDGRRRRQTPNDILANKNEAAAYE